MIWILNSWTCKEVVPFTMDYITKPDIVGARVIDVRATFEDLVDYECDCTTIYFTVDRGFSFTMPVPGYLWERAEIPRTAKRLPDESIEESNKFEGPYWARRYVLNPPKTFDIVRRIKERTILGVYCPQMDREIGFYEPDSALLVFDDGSQASCVSVAPKGLGATGLYYRTDVSELPKIDDLVDFFDVPLERDGGQHDATNG